MRKFTFCLRLQEEEPWRDYSMLVTPLQPMPWWHETIYLPVLFLPSFNPINLRYAGLLLAEISTASSVLNSKGTYTLVDVSKAKLSYARFIFWNTLSIVNNLIIASDYTYLGKKLVYRLWWLTDWLSRGYRPTSTLAAMPDAHVMNPNTARDMARVR